VCGNLYRRQYNCGVFFSTVRGFYPPLSRSPILFSYIAKKFISYRSDKYVTHLIQGKYNLEPAGGHLSHRQQVQRDRVWKSYKFLLCFYEFYYKVTFFMNKSCRSFTKINNSLFSKTPVVSVHVFLLMKGKKVPVQNTRIKQIKINVTFHIRCSTAETLSKLIRIRSSTDSMFSIFLLFRIGDSRGYMDWDTDSELGSWTTK
jgi:hypothetical protein